MSTTRVLDVGQCSFDHGTISRFLRQNFGVQVDEAETADDALSALRSEPYALVLVNRVFDTDGSSGIDLIRALKADPALSDVAVMLVSNYPDAQAQAIDLGALEGFGKAQLRDQATGEKLKQALARPS